MNELITEIYNYIPKKTSLTIKGRCGLQKLLRKALTYTLSDADYENFKYHADHFEDDILMIVSSTEMKINQELAVIGLASKRISERLSEL
ncbi:hypothetical protein Q5O14_17890 [Eubacteriaceae bacterium ES2]|nr:hypothetical protein Q5O14_17890 [Eubacteriaceae bacterium ES2]